MAEETLRLDIADLACGSPGLTPEEGESRGQAASVCMVNQGHNSPTPTRLSGDYSQICDLVWKTPNQQATRCWNDMQEATERGAYGIAALIVQQLMGLWIVERSRKGTGFDFWLGPRGTDGLLFQDKTRLEVSGILNGDDADISYRLESKVRQMRRSTGPGVAIVVEFGSPECRIRRTC